MLDLLTAEEMGRADKLATESGVAGATLMENAGRAVAEEVVRRYPDHDNVAILCGPGNNGGDGFVAARHLKERGYKVSLAFDGDETRLPADAAAMAARYAGARGPLDPSVLADADLVVDALFGAGLARPVEGKLAGLIESVNASRRPVVAVDVPSGIDGTTGEVRGVAVRANATVTFFRLKPGHLLLPGRTYCGEVRLADIGIPASVLTAIEPKTFANEPALWLGTFFWPHPESYKYSRGDAVVVSGPMYSTGAARLAARGALRIGAGLVTVASPRDALEVNAAQLTAIMVREADDARGLISLLADPRKNAVLIGPGVGVGERTKQLVLAVLRSGAAAVLDADALTSFAEDPKPLFAAIAAHTAPVVLTPHDGEFARLFGDLTAHPKLERTRLAAARAGAVVVLKGADTVVATPGGIASINATTSSFLATAGSGDVLAGIVLGLLAQKMPAFDAASAAVWLHGRAAADFGPGLIAEDLPETLPKVLHALRILAGSEGSSAVSAGAPGAG
jgi:ADP-dependent NAD(P)H-hydrate dehydratase / NAD(P)H-hydrate epimerase